LIIILSITPDARGEEDLEPAQASLQ
jgi:hypothetical protein